MNMLLKNLIIVCTTLFLMTGEGGWGGGVGYNPLQSILMRGMKNFARQ